MKNFTYILNFKQTPLVQIQPFVRKLLLSFTCIFLLIGSTKTSAQTVVGSTNSVGTNSVTITRPTGLQVGDLMIVNLQYTPNNALSYPSGWTERINYEGGSGSTRTRIAYKVATASDVTTASYVFSVSSGVRIAGGISAFRGVNTTTNGGINIIGTPFGTNSTTTTITPGQINTVEPNTMVLFFSQLRLQNLGFNTNWRLGGVSGTLMNQLYVQNAPNVSDGCGVSGAYYVQPVAGPTGSGYQTTGTGDARRAGILMALTRGCNVEATVTATDLSCFGTNDGTILITAPSGGSGTFEYRLDNGLWQPNGSFSGLSEGTYSVQVRDPNDILCVTTYTRTIIAPGTGGAGVITVVGSNTSTGNASVTITKPSGVQVGDLMIVNLQHTPENSVTYPAGWTERINYEGGSGSTRARIAYKVATTADLSTSNFTFSVSGGDRIAGGISAFRGVNTATNGGINVVGSSFGTNGTTTTITPAQITTAVDNEMVLFFSQLRLQNLSFNTNWRLGGASGTLMNQLYVQNAPNLSDGCGVSGAYFLKPLAGPTGSGYQTTANGDARRAGILMSLTPGVCNVDGTTNSTNVSCNGANNGSITVTNPTGGGGTYQYRLDCGTWQSSATFNGLAPGTYNVNIRDAVNTDCSNYIAEITITEPAAITATVAVSNISCFGDNSGTITVSNPTGGTGNFEASINGVNWFSVSSSSPRVFSSLPAGSYNVQVRSSGVCPTSLGSFDVLQPTILAVVVNTIQPTCTASGAIDVTASGGTAPYSYDWNDLAGVNNVEDRIGLVPGTFSLTVTDANGCVWNSGNIVLDPPTNCASIVACTNNSSEIYITTPNPEITSYTWSFNRISGTTGGNDPIFINGQGSSAITVDWNNTNPGTFELCVTANNVCGTSDETCRSIDVVEPVASASANLSCEGGDLQLFASGGISYQWTGPNGFISSSANPIILNASTSNSGTYEVAVTNNQGCVATATVNVTVQPAPVFTAAITATTCGGTTGAIDVTVTSGGTYSYLWSNGATTQDLNGVPPGNYSVTITNSNGCSSSQTYTIGASNGPSVVASVSNVLCSGSSTGSITITSTTGGDSPYTYTWSGPDGFAQTTMNISNLAAGTYNLTITDNLGCQGFYSQTITSPAALNVDFSKIDVTCFGENNGSINLIVSGGAGNYGYSWSTVGGSGLVAGAANQTGLTAGSYTVTVTDANNCSVIRTIEITQPAALLAAAASVTHVACFGDASGQIVLSISGGTGPYTFSWSATAPALVPSGQTTNQNITNLVAGTYSVLVTDAKGCTVSLPTIIVNQASAPLAVTGNPVPVSCNGGIDGGVILNTPTGGTAPYSYMWSNGSTTKDLSNVAAGNYSVIVTDILNCLVSASYTVVEPTLLVASVAATQNITCNNGSNGSISLNVSGGNGGNAFFWTSINGTIPTGQELLQNPSGLTAGTYNVLITDQNGCTTTTSATLTQPTPILVSATVEDVTCNNGSDGVINLVVSGGSGAGYTYSWSTLDGSNLNPTSQDQSGLTAGTYTVVVTDGNSCSSVAYNYTLDGPVPITLSMLNTNLSCAGGVNDGAIDLTITGGIAPFSFVWTTMDGSIPSGQSSLQSIWGLGTGVYTVVVTDFTGCSASLTSAPIVVPPALMVSASVINNVLCFGTSTGAAEAIATGGTPPYQYIWGNGETSIDAFELDPGQTSLTVIDAQGCTATTSVIIEEAAGQFAIFGIIKNVSSCSANTGAIIQVEPEFNTGLVTYSWTGPGGFSSTNADITGLAPGTYTVEAVDELGCVATTTFDVLTSPVLSLSVSPFSASCAGTDGQAYPVITGGVAPYTYLWSNGATASFLTNLSPGSYSLTITDADGCTANTSFNIGSASNCVTPVTTPDLYVANCGTLEGDVSSNDANTPVADFEYYAGGQASPEQGVLVWNNAYDGTFTFVPTPGFVGTVVIPYIVSHLPSGLSADGVLTINVTTCLTLPDVNIAFVNSQVPGDVATNDVLPSGSTYGTVPGTNVVTVSKPTGAVDLLQITASGAYTFQADLVGLYVYDVEVCSPTQTSPDCQYERLTITVLDGNSTQNPPITAPDFGVMVGNYGTIPLNDITLNIRANDLVGNDGGVLGTPTIVSQPTNGTASIDGTGNLVYTPNEGFYGQDYMQYEVCESPSTLCRTEQVYITVLGDNIAIKVVAVDDFAYGTMGQTITASTAATGMLANDYSTASAPALKGSLIGGTPTANAGETERTIAGTGTLTMQETGTYTFVPTAGFNGTVLFPYEVCDGTVCAKATLYITIESTIIRVFPKVFLEGPYNAANDNMNNALGTGGTASILAINALEHPYNKAPWPTVKQHNGTENVPASFFTTHTDIVDWVLIELRSKTNSANIVYRRAGLLKQDGSVIDVDGLPGLVCEGLAPDDYYIAIRHRNHLGVMGASTVYLDADPLGNDIDFTTTATTLYGTNAAVEVEPGVVALHMGNANPDNTISFTGPSNDKATIGIKVNSTASLINTFLGYAFEDIDMNGATSFTGPGNDKAILGIKLNSSINLLNSISEQLP